MNQLILGDNLEIMRKMESESIAHDGLEAIEVVKVKMNGEVVEKEKKGKK